MQCKLKKKDEGYQHGPTGESVEIGIESDEPASLSRIEHAGKADGTAPFELTIEANKKALVVSVFGAQDSQKIYVTEVAGDETQRLGHFYWSKINFFKKLIVVGD